MLNVIMHYMPSTASYITAFENACDILMAVATLAMIGAVVWDSFRAEMLSEEA